MPKHKEDDFLLCIPDEKRRGVICLPGFTFTIKNGNYQALLLLLLVVLTVGVWSLAVVLWLILFFK